MPTPWRHLILSGVAMGLGAAAARGGYIELGVADSLALDQPRVAFALENPNDPPVPLEELPPYFYNSGILDTGANGVLLAGLSYTDENLAVNPDLFERAQRQDESYVLYEEQGVAGSELLTVHVPHNLYFSGSNFQAQMVPDVTAFGSTTLDLDGWGAVVGMPAMAGRVTTLDLTPMGDVDLIGVAFSDPPAAPSQAPPAPPAPAAPAAPQAHTYHVNLTTLAPEYTGQQQPGDPLPTFVGLPMIPNVKAVLNGNVSVDTMLLDTGATITLITTQTALNLGINVESLPKDFPICGIGGCENVALTTIDRLAFPTVEGFDIHQTDVEVAILDVPGLGGVFGMNLLTGGWLDAVFGGPPGYLSTVELDFTGADGVMALELKASLDNPVQDGDANGDGVVGLLDLSALAANWNRQDADWASGDFTWDQKVDLLDLSILAQSFTSPALGLVHEGAPQGGAVPEPATFALLIVGLTLATRRRLRSPKAP